MSQPIIKLTKNFEKQLTKLVQSKPKLEKRIEERINLFITDRLNAQLKDHQLQGKKTAYRSFSITGDIRIIYVQESQDVFLFFAIGTHNQVYK